MVVSRFCYTIAVSYSLHCSGAYLYKLHTLARIISERVIKVINDINTVLIINKLFTGL